jgi:UDPglucose 6-dehydrogenase
MKIAVIGAGYVGLTTAACLAQIGHDVFCSESDAEKLRKLQGGIMPLFEPHLEKVAAQSADAILIVTEWDEFRVIDWSRLANVVE